MKYLRYFFIGIVIVAIIAFFLGRRLVASGLVVVLAALGAFAIALAILSWFKKQKLAHADAMELSQKLVEQETRNQTLEQSLLQIRQKLAEQTQHNQTLEQLLSQVKQNLAESEQHPELEQHRQILEPLLSQFGQKSSEPEQPPESEQHPKQHRQTLEQYQRDLDDAQVGFRDALTVLVSYQMAIRPIPGNYRGDYFVEKLSIDRINQMSIRSFSRWLRVIQNKQNSHSKDIREMLEGQRSSTIDLPTLETVMRQLLSAGEAGSS